MNSLIYKYVPVSAACLRNVFQNEGENLQYRLKSLFRKVFNGGLFYVYILVLLPPAGLRNMQKLSKCHHGKIMHLSKSGKVKQ